MIAEIGLAALWLAAALAVLQMISGALALRTRAREGGGDANPMAFYARPAAMVQAALAVLAFVMLLYAFAITDLSIKLVATNSHSAKPFIYKLTGTWGNHEGSMLLWVAVLALSGGLLAGAERRLPERTMSATLSVQGFVALGFYAFLLLSSNPFERLPVPALEGSGLNPLLQDIGLAIHPPTLYIGYVGLSVAFSLAMGALITRQVTPDFAKVMRPWVLGAWVFLTFGITAGSYWAYYELGWGGWWFWDPVENASLMPWLAATALLHSVSVLAARDALRTWTIMLGVLAFSMSMLGTFLVRSGVLTSVHAFAVDPERGTFILVLLGLYIGGALALFAVRAGSISEGKRFTATSREGALVFNNVMLSAILAIVLLGTLYPLLTEAFNVRVSVGPPYFNPASAIFAIPMFLVMAVGPLLRWKDDTPRRIQFELSLIAALLISVVSLVAILGDYAILPVLGLALAVGLGVAAFLPLRGRKLARVPVAVWGMVLAHFGVAVALFGMASESAFTQERLAAVSAGQTESIGGFDVMLESVDPVAGPNWTAIEARLAVSRDGGDPVMLAPQARNFWSPPQATSESALITRWNGQLYAVIGDAAGVDAAGNARWQLRLWWKPFVTFIWYGGLLIALGGVLAIAGRVQVDLRRRTATRLGEERREGLRALGKGPKAPEPAE
ncbi:cytochrome c-type biogenesis protein CcmF [Erythrobacter litoralis]|uniref:Cytochrome C biogenesis protein CcmF n=1 Tax=Erythrobacter litoralis TaxID=39960 RepID=A0A074N3A7_9SPHN|nr:heme lyase CcmF/NrfE family subunit [Erythrobacter litoralis]AOL23900.1 cytochrome c-type biogenesis protein CcmF [Erythrobacter litoralis]KEO98618.1 cytochrome C biogenesis protein CcmF [Erythrobacter litoralis]